MAFAQTFFGPPHSSDVFSLDTCRDPIPLEVLHRIRRSAQTRGNLSAAVNEYNLNKPIGSQTEECLDEYSCEVNGKSSELDESSLGTCDSTVPGGDVIQDSCPNKGIAGCKSLEPIEWQADAGEEIPVEERSPKSPESKTCKLPLGTEINRVKWNGEAPLAKVLHNARDGSTTSLEVLPTSQSTLLGQPLVVGSTSPSEKKSIPVTSALSPSPEVSRSPEVPRSSPKPADMSVSRRPSAMSTPPISPGKSESAPVIPESGLPPFSTLQTKEGSRNEGVQGAVQPRERVAATTGSMIATFLKQGYLPPTLLSKREAEDVITGTFVGGIKAEAGDRHRTLRVRTPCEKDRNSEETAPLLLVDKSPTVTVTRDNCRVCPRVDRRDPFCKSSWPPALKRRRRTFCNPGHSGVPTSQPGARVLYWVSGSLRVRDNLALGVCMWLSHKLRMPLQVIAFVDPCVGQATTPPPEVPDDAGGSDEVEYYGRGVAGGKYSERGQSLLPFPVAVEVSALCEMEESLQDLNIPIVALPCATADIPRTLSLWCRGYT
ncbi:unnamed protein product, partial [Choristocarpus tenellus]